MNRKKMKKRLYVKPDTEVIAMDPEGGLLLTASTVTMGGGTSGTNAFGGGSIISNRQKTRPATGGTSSTSAFGKGTVISSRSN